MGRRASGLSVTVPGHLAKQLEQLDLLSTGQATQIPERTTHLSKQSLTHPAPRGRQHDVAHPPILGALLTAYEFACGEAIDEAGDVGAVAPELARQLVHRKWLIEL